MRSAPHSRFSLAICRIRSMVSWAIRGFRFLLFDLRCTVVDYSTLPVTAEQVAMPAEQSFWLDNVQGLLPELGAAAQEDQSNAIAIGELGPFYLTVEYNELLSQHRVFSNQVSAAAGHI